MRIFGSRELGEVELECAVVVFMRSCSPKLLSLLGAKVCVLILDIGLIKSQQFLVHNVIEWLSSQWKHGSNQALQFLVEWLGLRK